MVIARDELGNEYLYNTIQEALAAGEIDPAIDRIEFTSSTGEAVRLEREDDCSPWFYEWN